MISYKNKSFFATIVMAITLARAAPFPDDSGPEEIHIVKALSGNDAQLSPVQVEVGNHSMHIASPKIKEHQHHHHHHQHQSHQAKLNLSEVQYSPSLSEEIPCCSSGEELAQHVIELRDYIETLDEDQFDGFLEQYLQYASKDEMFALELALDLDATEEDDSDEEDNDDEGDSSSSFSEPWDMEDDNFVNFVPYKKLHHGHHAHDHPFKQQFERKVGCTEKEIKLGLCNPVLEYSSHHHHYQSHHHHHHHHHLEKELECSQVEEEQGQCLARGHSNQQHHTLSHPRQGVVIGDSHHSRVHRELIGTDGYPLGQRFNQHSQQDNDRDLLGKKIEQSLEPVSFAIIQQAVGGPRSGLIKPELAIKAPQDAVKLHVEGISMLPQDADQVSSKDITV